jgi:AcrR family transcriptional regulator
VRDGVKTSEAIREAAAELFFKQGYEATSLRAVAAQVGIQVGSLYNHISGKEELLADLMVAVMDELERAVESAVRSAEENPVARLRAALDAHIRYHAQHARETFVGNSELRALGSDNRKEVLARRSRYERYLRQLITDAAAEWGAELIDPKLQTYAVLALGMHVASWFRPRGSVSLQRVVDTYTRISLRQMGIDEGAGTSSHPPLAQAVTL